jgi:hypothetical protein
MFMCYTHYGIGHPKVVRETVRDCANVNTDSLDSAEDEDREGDTVAQKSVPMFVGFHVIVLLRARV